MLLKNIFFIVLLPFISLSDNPYDTSTPKKFVESLGMINQQPKSENPLPYFYEKEFAVALTNFDETNESNNLVLTEPNIAFPATVLTNANADIFFLIDIYYQIIEDKNLILY